MGIKINASRKTTIILLVVLFLIVGGTGGYLLWRVNQEDTVAPIDSDASSNQLDNCCCDNPTGGCAGIRKCKYEKKCVAWGTTPGVCKSWEPCVNGFCDFSDKPCTKNENCSCMKSGDPVSVCTKFEEILTNGPECKCTNVAGCCASVPQCECTSGSQCPACHWPNVAYCHAQTGCTCLRYDADDQNPNPKQRCDDTTPCVRCPEGYERTSVTGNCKDGEKAVSGSCRCSGCDNAYTATVCCKPIATNTCGDGTKGGTEDCDPPGSTCPNGKKCDGDCKCPASPPVLTCGNGKIDEGEDCEPSGSTCPNGQTCDENCKCPEKPPDPPPPPTENTCDGIGANAEIELRPSSPGYCDNVRYLFVVADKEDGVGENNVKVKLGSEDLIPDVNDEDPDNNKRRFIEGTISGKTYNCNTNEQTLTISWVDAKGNSNKEGKCTRTIKYTPGANTCYGGGWDTNGNPGNTNGTRTYKYCENISYSATGEDPHGIGDMTVKLNNQSRSVTPVKTETTATVSEVLSSSSNCLAPGTYTLDISWVDKYGVGGSGACALTTKFVVSEEIQPEWEIEKIPAELCIDENTENPKAELSYKIQIKNTGSVSGEITQIVDTLDPKVHCGVVSDISDSGECNDGKITWILTSPLSDFGSGESKEFSYKYAVNKESFGEYENLVVATVGATGTEGEKTIQDNSNIAADCEIDEPLTPGEVPETGLFDESENIVILGTILLFLGLGWTWLNRTYEIVNGKLVQRNKQRFERRVVNN